MANKRRTKKSTLKKRVTILIVEIVFLAFLLLALYVWGLFDKIDFQQGLTDSEAGINSDLDEETLLSMSDYTNIALFGLDNRSEGNYSTGRSDTIMVASINNKTKEVKLVSVYRDTYLSIGNGKYKKANNAYSVGGPQQAVQMLNTNLDLDIKDYVCVDWAALVKAIDALGGLDIEISTGEMEQINKYMKDVDKVTGKTTPKLTTAGLVHLDGTQATTYARIRKLAGDDFKRASRQRIVLQKMLEKAKKSDIGTLLKICEGVFPEIATSLEYSEILKLAKDIMSYELVSTTGFPFDLTTKKVNNVGDAVIAVELDNNVAQLHAYMFGNENYKLSPTVSLISDTIVEQTGVDETAAKINTSKYNETIDTD